MSKLSFRARALDASKPMPIYLAEELPDLPDYSAINRAVPQMPSGMEKEEECEHHLQRAICTGLIIPTPEVMEVSDAAIYDRLYPADYRMPRQLIHMQPLGLEQDVPDYDMDSEDERWLKKQQSVAGARRCDLTEVKFEETMERLERSSGQTVVTLREARALAGKSGPAEHLLAAVYDYWLNKRLATQQPLLLAVRTEARPGAPSPYLAFRRRTEKMQTRKNRKNDESSYEKMVKLRRELSRAVSLLELVRRRERAKRELVRLAAVLLDKRYQARDFSGHMIAEAAAQRVAVAPPILAPPYTAPLHHRPPVDAVSRQREKRQYKRRKHRHHSVAAQPHTLHHGVVSGSSSSSEGEAAEAAPPPDPSGPFAFRRKPGCQYHMPTASFGPSVDVPWRSGCAKENTCPGDPDQRLRYTLTSLSHPTSRFIGFTRRRLGRGGRVILDRLSTTDSLDRLWEAMDYTIIDSHNNNYTRLADSAKCQEETSATDNNGDTKPTEKFNPSNDVQQCINKTDVDVKGSDERLDIVIKTEVTEDTLTECGGVVNSYDNEWNVTTSNRVRYKSDCSNKQLDSTIKMEMEYENDTETIQNSVSGCVSVISDNLDNSFNERREESSKERSSRDEGRFRVSDEDRRSMTEMLVRRGLRRYETRRKITTAAEVDQIFDDCIHFRPQSPLPSPPPSPLRDSPEGDIRLGEGAPITVQVLPSIGDCPSDMLFQDTSLYTTSEFTLSDLYGDSLLPETSDPLDTKSITPWIHTNGPDKLDANSDCVSESSKSTTFKDTLTENSSSNHTSVFTPSDGTPNSLNSCEDSNHAIAGTNGIEWSNDSNGSEKINVKFEKINNLEDVKPNEKRLGSSVFTVRSFENDKQIFLASEKAYRPVSPPQATPAPQPGIFIPISGGQAVKRRPEGQGMAVVQVRSPSVVRQMMGRPPLLVAAQHVKALPSGHKVVQAGQKIVQATAHNTVSKIVQQQIGRKLQHDAARRLANEEQIIVSTSGNQVGVQGGQQQMVAVAGSEPLKLRLQGHLLATSQRDGVVQGGVGGRRTVVQLGGTGGGVSGGGAGGGVGGGGAQVKVVRTLTAAQRTKLLQAAGGSLRDLQGGPLRDLAGVLQLQVRPNQTYTSESLDGRTVHINDASTTNATIPNAVVVSQGNANNNNGGSVVVNSNQSPGQTNTGTPTTGQTRKGPMEVT